MKNKKRTFGFADTLPSRKRVEHIRFGSADFPLYFADFFLNIRIFLKKIGSSMKKIRYFETASHHMANKFPVDFVGF